MENAEWQEIVESLVAAKRGLANAWELLDGIDGAAPGVAFALHAALASIDAIYAAESANAFNQDVASPAGVQQFWEEHRTLPGFAIGS